MILRRSDPLSCSLKRVHADVFMLACTLFDEQDKGSNHLRINTRSVLQKRNVQAKNDLSCLSFYYPTLLIKPDVLFCIVFHSLELFNE